MPFLSPISPQKTFFGDRGFVLFNCIIYISGFSNLELRPLNLLTSKATLQLDTRSKLVAPSMNSHPLSPRLIRVDTSSHSI